MGNNIILYTRQIKVIHNSVPLVFLFCFNFVFVYFLMVHREFTRWIIEESLSWIKVVRYNRCVWNFRPFFPSLPLFVFLYLFIFFNGAHRDFTRWIIEQSLELKCSGITAVCGILGRLFLCSDFPHRCLHAIYLLTEKHRCAIFDYFRIVFNE